MSKEFETFDLFIDDIISSEMNLLKGELDLLLMQYIFDSIDLKDFKHLNNSIDNDFIHSYLAA